MKKDQTPQSIGAAVATLARTAWEQHALALYAQSLKEHPSLGSKARRHAVASFLNKRSIHPVRITDAMILGALRRPGSDETLISIAIALESSGQIELSEDEEKEIESAAEHLNARANTELSAAFNTLERALRHFRAVCILTDRTDAFDLEVQRATKLALEKPPARLSGQ